MNSLLEVLAEAWDVALAALLEMVKRSHPGADLEVLERAYHWAARAHGDQRRESGELFIEHPLQVAMILAELELDVTTLTAGLLHDVLEDTDVTPEELEAEFGPEVRSLVDGVTKLNRIPFQTREEHQAQSLRKMFLAMAEDLRVVLIKLADRLHNMRTLHHLPPERQRKIATETLEIYAPLAHRLGMWAMKWELEDLAFRCLHPEEFRKLVDALAKKRQEREEHINEVVRLLRERLEAVGIRAEVQGRPKNLYSIYTKMKRQGKELSEIYDLNAVRVLVDTVRDCYACLGLVHTMWKPVPGRFKDYVAMPKSNMYQSLHTTVIGPRGEPVEVQIRTWEMHRIAEKGIAAHWLYKEGQDRNVDFEKKVAWLREVMEWLREMKDPQEFMETLKIDLFEDEVFVFTPKGDVISLPAGATPVDFAFAVHTDIGLRCAGARVNGKMVPLSYQLSNGEFVEIIVSKHPAPSQDWLHFVKTSKARSKIRSWLKEARREENVNRGREILEREAKRLGVELKDLTQSPHLEAVLRRYGLADLDDLLAALGFGRLTAAQVAARLLGRDDSKRRRQRVGLAGRNGPGVRVQGADNLLLRLSKCCSPVPGDPITGYITRGRGISVHRVDCPNLVALCNGSNGANGRADRRVEVEWDVAEGGPFPVDITIEALDRVNLLAQILNAVSDGRTNIEAVHTHTTPDNVVVINLTVDIQDVDHMNRILNRIRSVSGVMKAERAVRH